MGQVILIHKISQSIKTTEDFTKNQKEFYEYNDIIDLSDNDQDGGEDTQPIENNAQISNDSDSTQRFYVFRF